MPGHAKMGVRNGLGICSRVRGNCVPFGKSISPWWSKTEARW